MGQQFFPRRRPKEVTPNKCSRTNIAQACDARRVAIAKGEMKPDFNLGAWVFPDDPRRMVTTEMRIKGETENDLDPYSWFVCPWCGEELCSVFMLRPPIDCGET